MFSYFYVFLHIYTPSSRIFSREERMACLSDKLQWSNHASNFLSAQESNCVANQVPRPFRKSHFGLLINLSTQLFSAAAGSWNATAKPYRTSVRRKGTATEKRYFRP
eukprot:Pompholyxophrys_punicea_v1_NODE_144_length_3209_cov_54.434686.p3 type:complete len:107 gc:universal NODE_144_length_3209_cov_54.434686:2640-2320(-)